MRLACQGCSPSTDSLVVLQNANGRDLVRCVVTRKRPALFRGRHFEDVIILLCLRWYLRYSLARRMRGGVEMENAAPMMLDDEEAVQHTETQRGHGEIVEGGDHLTVVPEIFDHTRTCLRRTTLPRRSRRNNLRAGPRGDNSIKTKSAWPNISLPCRPESILAANLHDASRTRIGNLGHNIC